MSDITTRVYQFLSTQTDWKTDADANGDGAITKREFSNWMKANFSWNGEESEDTAQTDLINKFWKTVDTNTTGKCDSTKIKNAAALDKKEQQAMQTKVDAYQILNDICSDISAPSGISDKSGWLSSVKESLSNTLETLINKGATSDEIQAALEEALPEVEAKTTANVYAQEYIKQVASNIQSEYGYNIVGDNTLQSMIDSYIQSNVVVAFKNGDTVDDSEILNDVESMVEGYLATAGIGTGDVSSLSALGLAQSDNSALNDLQKAVIRTNLTNNLKEITNEASYKDHSDLYDTAVNNYIESVLSDGKYSEFATLKALGIDDFKTSEEYTSVQNAINAENVLSSDELKSALTSAISASFVEKISNLMSGEVPVLDNIKSEFITKAQNGDFTVDGKFDQTSAINWFVEQCEANLSSFYTNGFGDMSLEELEKMYNALATSTRANDDVAGYKAAAQSYCEALSSKNTKYADAITEILGGSYKTVLADLTSSEIEQKMTEIKAKIAEIGDYTTMTAQWADGNDSLTLYSGKIKAISVSATVGNISSSRITYETDSSFVTVNANTLTITAPSQGEYTINVYAVVDGVRVGSPKAIKLEVPLQTIAQQMETDDRDLLTVDGKALTIKELMSGTPSAVQLSWKKGGYDKNAAISTLNGYIDNIATKLKEYGYSESVVAQATTTTKNFYKALINVGGTHGDSSDVKASFTYTDASGTEQTVDNETYASAKGRKVDRSERTDDDSNTTGIQFTHDTQRSNKNEAHTIYIDMSKLFQKMVSFMSA